MKSKTTGLPTCHDCRIRNTALFGELELEQINKIVTLRSEQTLYEAGEYLYYEGDTATRAFTVYEGWVVLFKNLENGERQILSFALPGDFISYETGRNIQYDHSAIAASKVTLCTFPLNRFRECISVLPDLAFAINSIVNTATKRCHSSLTAIASYPAEAKVAALLLSLFIRVTRGENQSDCIAFPLTQEDIADTLGLSVIHVNRVFQSLRKQGLIECKSRCLTIPDKRALAEKAMSNLEKMEELLLGVKK